MFTHAVTRALRKNKTLRYGVPMLLLVVGGSFGLREFSQIRYDAVKIKIDPELEKKLKMNQVSLESEYEVPHMLLLMAHTCNNFWRLALSRLEQHHQEVSGSYVPLIPVTVSKQ
ncbi:PREDICTED: cytochrome c oxidase assembly protein COX16 homolog, mitochondrial isoform X1 [Myotis davidii]|uniref:cytochrome c oxidase assembly protein COX16 homolog, mitochondrial isoform X1 n=1 Tax=Myotis davidii TaxID=225400 RepID=UPI0003EC50C4|nr:PREDICTED: cytochrome c oxidase assembly protein COX16 homolog, mitochondrial isoform X1 [Myotis davidii]